MSDLDLPDVNVLVALVHPAHIHHAAAQRWFSSTARFATCPITESGFLRVTMNPTATGAATTMPTAVAALAAIRSDVRAEFLADDSSLVSSAIDLRGLGGFRQVTEFHLLNLAARYAGRLVTFDRKISRAVMPDDQQFVHALDQ